jgi:hypothetical protein
MPRLFQLEAAHFEKTFGFEHSRLIVWGSALTVQKGAAADANFFGRRSDSKYGNWDKNGRSRESWRLFPFLERSR